MADKKKFILVKIIKKLQIYWKFKLNFPKKVEISYLGGNLEIKRLRVRYCWSFIKSLDI